MKKTISEIFDFERISIHEASHGLVEYVLGFPITAIRVNPLEGYGECPYDEPDTKLSVCKSRGIPETDRRVMIYCAGNAGEFIWAGTKKCWRRTPDYRYAADLLAPVCENKAEIRAYIELMWARAVNLLRKPRNWWAVQKLADSLRWCPMEPDRESCWYGSDMADELPDEFWEREPGLRDMDGETAQNIIGEALIEYTKITNFINRMLKLGMTNEEIAEVLPHYIKSNRISDVSLSDQTDMINEAQVKVPQQ